MKIILLFLAISTLLSCHSNHSKVQQGDPNFFKSIRPMSGVYSQEKNSLDSNHSVESPTSTIDSHPVNSQNGHGNPPPPMPQKIALPTESQTISQDTIVVPQAIPSIPYENSEIPNLSSGSIENNPSPNRFIPPPPMPKQNQPTTEYSEIPNQSTQTAMPTQSQNDPFITTEQEANPVSPSK